MSSTPGAMPTSTKWEFSIWIIQLNLQGLDLPTTIFVENKEREITNFLREHELPLVKKEEGELDEEDGPECKKSRICRSRETGVNNYNRH